MLGFTGTGDQGDGKHNAEDRKGPLQQEWIPDDDCRALPPEDNSRENCSEPTDGRGHADVTQNRPRNNQPRAEIAHKADNHGKDQTPAEEQIIKHEDDLGEDDSVLVMRSEEYRYAARGPKRQIIGNPPIIEARERTVVANGSLHQEGPGCKKPHRHGPESKGEELDTVSSYQRRSPAFLKGFLLYHDLRWASGNTFVPNLMLVIHLTFRLS